MISNNFSNIIGYHKANNQKMTKSVRICWILMENNDNNFVYLIIILYNKLLNIYKELFSSLSIK